MKKTILILIVLIALYELFLRIYTPGLSKSQIPTIQNLITAEDYLFNTQNLESSIVIIASSLSKKLVSELLPKNSYNLSFSGGSIHDGLKILNSNSAAPDYVLIETTRPTRKRNEAFLANLLSPVTNYKKKTFQLFLTKNQPVLLVKKFIHKFVYKNRPNHKRQVKNEQRENAREQIIQFRIDDISYSERIKLLPQAFIQIREEISILESKGVKVIFYDPPIHKTLCDLPIAFSIKNRWLEYFPKKRYSYITQPDCSEFNTTDGIHLTKESAVRYTNYLINSLVKIME